MAIRLVALDLDGTALDSRAELRPAVVDAVARARARGVRVVACTGRRYRTALPVIRALGLHGPAVVQNGVVVRDSETGATLERRALPEALYAHVLDAYRRVGAPLVYVDAPHTDFFYEPIERAHAFQAEYLRDHGGSGTVVDDLAARPSVPVVMMSCMADGESLARVHAALARELGRGARTHQIRNKNYRGDILEVVSPAAGKWSGVEWVCAREGIDPKEVLAIGDDANDAEMIERAGIGVAMANAVDAAKRVADHVVEGNDADGAAIAIDRFAG